MPLYINKLAPWEEKRDYLQEQVFRNDMSHNIGNVDKALKKQLALDIKHSKDILISQERISEGIDNLADSLGSIKDGVNEIGAILEWGFSEIIWQLEQSREYLKQIVEVLMAPLDTKARERKKRAEKALANGWYQDAEEEFLISEELNKFDFTIHINLGMIYLFHNIDKHKAATYFEKAVKYAKADSNYYACFAALHLGLAYRDLGEIEKAEASLAEAISLYPEMAEAHYQYAIYNALLGNKDKAISGLKEAIKLNRFYSVKAAKDTAFSNLSSEFDSLIDLLKQEANAKALKLISEKRKPLTTIDEFCSELQESKIINCDSSDPHKALNRAKLLVDRNSFLEVLEANDLLASLDDIFCAFLEKIQSKLGDALSSIKNTADHQFYSKSNKVDKIKNVLKFLIIPLVLTLVLIWGISSILDSQQDQFSMFLAFVFFFIVGVPGGILLGWLIVKIVNELVLGTIVGRAKGNRNKVVNNVKKYCDKCNEIIDLFKTNQI